MSAKTRAKPPNDSKVTIPITPMLDMTFQLLFFFIINFKPSKPEGQIEMALPSENVVANKDQNPATPPKGADKNLLEFPSDVTVKVRTQLDGINDGEISAMAVRNLEGKETPVDGLEGLKKTLTEMREQTQQKDNIKVQGDGKLKVRNLMKVMDACRQAGFKNVSMIPPEDFGR